VTVDQRIPGARLPLDVVRKAIAERLRAMVEERALRQYVSVLAAGFMYDTSFSPDEKFFVTASGDGEARIWATGLDAMVDTACRRLRRNLTPQEARQYLGVENPPQTCRS